MNRTRQGYYLVEMLVHISIIGVLISFAGGITVFILRTQRQLSSEGLNTSLLDQACLDLRIDTAGLWTLQDGHITTPNATWTCTDGWLKRNGKNRAPCAWTLQENTKKSCMITITPSGAPARTIELPRRNP